MGWLDSVKDKKKLPKVFENKSEDDIVKMLDDAAKDKEKITELENKTKDQDRQVDEIKTEFEKVKTQLATAEANRNKPPEKKNDEVIQFTDDPDAALNQRLKPLADITIQNAATTARILAQQQLDASDVANKTMDGRLFRMWANDITAATKGYTAIQLASPDAWIGIYFHLKGTRADELANPEIRKKKYNFLEPSSTTVSTNVEDTKKTPNEQLTDAEKHVADKMGVSYENYLKRKQSMTVVTA